MNEKKRSKKRNLNPFFRSLWWALLSFCLKCLFYGSFFLPLPCIVFSSNIYIRHLWGYFENTLKCESIYSTWGYLSSLFFLHLIRVVWEIKYKQNEKEKMRKSTGTNKNDDYVVFFSAFLDIYLKPSWLEYLSFLMFKLYLKARSC